MARPVSLIPKNFPLSCMAPFSVLARVVEYSRKAGGHRGSAVRELIELGLEAAGTALRPGESCLLAKGDAIEFRIALDPSKPQHQDALLLFEARAAALAEPPRARLDRLREEAARKVPQ